MIQVFASRETELLFQRERVKQILPNIRRTALRKLVLIDAAVSINDLRVPPGNRLEQLSGNRNGQYSIRINNQWRVCFRFQNGNAFDVEIVDYH